MDLTAFITTIIRYKYFDKHASIQKLSDILRNSSAVWQKFAQMLSYNEELIDPELAIELQKMLTKCPIHDHEISYKIIHKSFHYKINRLKLLGSGTIAQTYKAFDSRTNKDIVFKVLHPNARNDAREARETYLGVRSSYFFPDSFKTPCDVFFESIVEQTDMKREYNNGKTMKQMYQTNKTNNNLFIFPEMLDYSSDCLVMSYEPSTPILLENRKKMPVGVLLRCCHAVDLFSALAIVHGFIHADMHFGNYGIRHCDSEENMKIVIYDFGAVSDIRDISVEMRTKFIIGALNRDTKKIVEYLFHDFSDHIPKINKLLTGDYVKNYKTMSMYIAQNRLPFSPSKMKFALAGEKYAPLINIINSLRESNSELIDYKTEHGMKAFLTEYFDYDDLKLLRDLYYTVQKEK
jgi:predicted unusual protein kinase regulating ubiquinone biosynthesis (AarF/ABC1/UbiB family)